jgi:hypothetical protein
LICKTSKNNSPSRNVTRGIMIIISISDWFIITLKENNSKDI